MTINQLHVVHLIEELRRHSAAGLQRVADYDDDGLHVSIASSLMNDAAEALELFEEEHRQQKREVHHNRKSPPAER